LDYTDKKCCHFKKNVNYFISHSHSPQGSGLDENNSLEAQAAEEKILLNLINCLEMNGVPILPSDL
jgi:hypothetical protein